MKAFVDIRTTRGFANRMQTQPAQLRLQIVYGFKICVRLAQPRWEPGATWLELNQTTHLESFSNGVVAGKPGALQL